MADEKDTAVAEEQNPSTDAQGKEETKEEAAPAADESSEASAKEEEAKEEKSPSADAQDKKEVPAEFKDIIERIEKMTVLEAFELKKAIEDHFGVVAAAAAAAPAAGGGEEAGEAQTEFTVELAEAGAQKIAVIKVVKEAAGLGLKEAKDLVDGAPSEIKTGLKKEDAEDLKAKLEEAGAKVNLK